MQLHQKSEAFLALLRAYGLKNYDEETATVVEKSLHAQAYIFSFADPLDSWPIFQLADAFESADGAINPTDFVGADYSINDVENALTIAKYQRIRPHLWTNGGRNKITPGDL